MLPQKQSIHIFHHDDEKWPMGKYLPENTEKRLFRCGDNDRMKSIKENVHQFHKELRADSM
jgi:hypothetical protein